MENSVVKIRPIDNEDKINIIDQVARNFNLDFKSLVKIWNWLFELNPYHKYNDPAGWVMEKNGIVIGSISEFPQLINICGKQQIVKYGSFFLFLLNIESQSILLNSQGTISSQIMITY